MSGGNVGLSLLEERRDDAYTIEWVEAREAAKCPTMHKRAPLPAPRDLSGSKCQLICLELEKLCPKRKSINNLI